MDVFSLNSVDWEDLNGAISRPPLLCTRDRVNRPETMVLAFPLFSRIWAFHPYPVPSLL